MLAVTLVGRCRRGFTQELANRNFIGSETWPLMLAVDHLGKDPNPGPVYEFLAYLHLPRARPSLVVFNSIGAFTSYAWPP